MEDDPVFDMSDLDEARRRLYAVGQVATQMSRKEYTWLHKVVAIDKRMLRLGKRRDFFGRILFYLSLIPSAIWTALYHSRSKRLGGAYDFYSMNRSAIEYVHKEPISDTMLLVTFYRKKPAEERIWH